MRRYARRWAKQHGQATATAYVPLSFAPGEASVQGRLRARHLRQHEDGGSIPVWHCGGRSGYPSILSVNADILPWRPCADIVAKVPNGPALIFLLQKNPTDDAVLQVGPESGVGARVPATGARNQGCSAEAKEIAYRLKPSGLDTFLFEHPGILAPVPPKLSDDPKTLCIPASIVSHILSWDRQNLLHFARHIGRHQREDEWVSIVGPGSIFEAKNSVEVIFRLYQFNKCGHDPTYPLSC